MTTDDPQSCPICGAGVPADLMQGHVAAHSTAKRPARTTPRKPFGNPTPTPPEAGPPLPPQT